MASVCITIHGVGGVWDFILVLGISPMVVGTEVMGDIMAEAIGARLCTDLLIIRLIMVACMAVMDPLTSIMISTSMLTIQTISIATGIMYQRGM